MSKFSEEIFVKKLSELNSTQQCIQTLSLWLIHHRKHSKPIVEVWYRELMKAPAKKRLTFLYLANDVVQNSRKKGPEFAKDFNSTIPKAYSITSRDADDKTKQSMLRMVKIWRERGVFPDDTTGKLIAKMESKLGQPSQRESTKLPSKSESKPSKSESKPSSLTKPKTQKSKPEPKSGSDSSKSSSSIGPPPSKKRKPELSLKEELEKESDVLAEPRPPPEAEQLAKALSELENAASSDAVVREKIAALPKEVSEASYLDKITDKVEAEKLSTQVEEACSLLEDYNSRLNSELQDRKAAARMLQDYIAHQKEVLGTSQKKLEEYKSKLEKVSHVRKELTSHIQSLPDLTLLPDVTGGLAPLPSAGDLFSER